MFSFKYFEHCIIPFLLMPYGTVVRSESRPIGVKIPPRSNIMSSTFSHENSLRSILSLLLIHGS